MVDRFGVDGVSHEKRFCRVGVVVSFGVKLWTVLRVHEVKFDRRIKCDDAADAAGEVREVAEVAPPFVRQRSQHRDEVCSAGFSKGSDAIGVDSELSGVSSDVSNASADVVDGVRKGASFPRPAMLDRRHDQFATFDQPKGFGHGIESPEKSRPKDADDDGRARLFRLGREDSNPQLPLADFLYDEFCRHHLSRIDVAVKGRNIPKGVAAKGVACKRQGRHQGFDIVQ